MTTAADPQEGTAGIVVADRQGIIRHWSEGAERLFGHARAQAEGKSLDLIVPADYRARHWAAFHQAMASGVCKIDRKSFHLPVVCSDGGMRLCAAHFIFLADALGRATGAAVVYTESQPGASVFDPVAAG